MRLQTAVAAKGMVLATSLVASLCSPAIGAEFELRVLPDGQGAFMQSHSEVVLTGAIEVGDVAHLTELLSDIQNFPGHHTRLRLNSLGGSFQEGLALADLVNARGLPTYVGQTDQCLSACALIFMSGAALEGDGERPTSRFMHHEATIGFHAPFTFQRDLEIPEEARALLVVDAERRAMEAGSALVRMSVDGRMPSHLIEALMLVDQEEFLLVDTVDRAGLWRIQLENRLVVQTLHHIRMEEYCTNVFAWQSALRYENRGDLARVGLIPSGDGDLLGTPMMEFSCDLRVSLTGPDRGPVVVDETRRQWVHAWQTLPGNIALADLGPEEISGATGPIWDVRMAPNPAQPGAFDFSTIRDVRGPCVDGMFWHAGWTGTQTRTENGELVDITSFDDATTSFASYRSCSDESTLFGMQCFHGAGEHWMRVSYGSRDQYESDGVVEAIIDGESFVFSGTTHGTPLGPPYINISFAHGHPFLDALSGGSQVVLSGDNLNRTLHLSGSARAIETMQLACR